MPALRSTLHWVIGTLLLALVLRTWLVMGLIEPITVAGSSMAPHLRGNFVSAQCSQCKSLIDAAAGTPAATVEITCPHCGAAKISFETQSIRRGDRLWIDRTVFQWRQPRRWEVVVLRSPVNDDQLCVKRVVGLPGETVELRNGDVWINGQVAPKSLTYQRAMRLPIYCNEKFITDDLPYNVGLSRPLQLVQDFMLTAQLRMIKPGSVSLQIDAGQKKYRVTITQPGGKLLLSENDHPLRAGHLSELSRKRLGRGEVELEFSNFDRQLLLAVEGRVEMSERLADFSPPTGVAQPVSVTVSGPEVNIFDQKIFRDIYYTPQSVGLRQQQTGPLQLGPDEYFVLGDNAAISVDSRSWGPIPAKQLIGKPMLDR